MDCLCVRLAWSNAPGSVALLLRPPFSSSCVRISHATPLDSAAACMNEDASFQWCITPHLALRIRVCLSSNGNFTLCFADPLYRVGGAHLVVEVVNYGSSGRRCYNLL